jgi:hypothetical protein
VPGATRKYGVVAASSAFEALVSVVAVGDYLSVVDLETHSFENAYSTVLAAFEVAGAKSDAGSDLVGNSQDGLGRVAAAVPAHLIGASRAEAMVGKEGLRAEAVVFLDCAYDIGASDLAPSGHAPNVNREHVNPEPGLREQPARRQD